MKTTFTNKTYNATAHPTWIAELTFVGLSIPNGTTPPDECLEWDGKRREDQSYVWFVGVEGCRRIPFFKESGELAIYCQLVPGQRYIIGWEDTYEENEDGKTVRTGSQFVMKPAE